VVGRRQAGDGARAGREAKAPAEAPSTLSIIGRYILTADQCSVIWKTPSKGAGGEIQLTDGMVKLIGSSAVPFLREYDIRGIVGETLHGRGRLRHRPQLRLRSWPDRRQAPSRSAMTAACPRR
jgi:hypothetical protein